MLRLPGMVGAVAVSRATPPHVASRARLATLEITRMANTIESITAFRICGLIFWAITMSIFAKSMKGLAQILISMKTCGLVSLTILLLARTTPIRRRIVA
jgi:hypothetical protein